MSSIEIDPERHPLNLAVVVASTRAGRFGPTVADWFVDQVGRRDEFAVDVIDLAVADLPTRLGGAATSALDKYRARLDRADAFVVVTPEYNHGYPASVKQGIDLANREWHAKPVGFVSYGGRSGGLRAVEQLRQVFAEVHAVTVRETVSLQHPWSSLGVAPSPGLEHAVEAMLDRLAWWATALRTARAARPYAA